MIQEKRIHQLYSASLLRKGIYSIEEVLAKRVDVSTHKDKIKVEFDEDLIKMNSQRYEVFDVIGTTCVSCGIQGQYFAKERSSTDYPYHFNLYAVNEMGEEVLMTKDHIVPRSKGGRNHLENYQPMCTICNFNKGNNEDIAYELIKI